MTIKKLPIGIQNIEKLITENYLYIDKTSIIHQLITEGTTYFLSRPRRFGKSLLISTLEAIFKGNKKLFTGLDIENLEWDWQEHPVIRIDFSEIPNKTSDLLIEGIKDTLEVTATEYGVTIKRKKPIETILSNLIRELAAQKRVAILIDEYDKPILDNINNMELGKEMREILKGFYTTLKAQDQYLKFVLLTGVSKFSKVGVFSGLNNLDDISMDTEFATMLGYTQEELEKYFKQQIDKLAEQNNLTKKEILEKIRKWYNGYCFNEDSAKVYNPFSTLLLFKKQKFNNYWFESGTPTFLLKLIKQQNYNLSTIDRFEINELAFSSYEIEKLSILPLLIQTGYLTIKEFYKNTGLYKLDYPNYEVKNSFFEYLIETYSDVEKFLATNYVNILIKSLKEEDFESFFETLKVFFANIPYDLQLKKEQYYQTIFYIIFTLIGLQVEAEVRTNKGRIDAVIVLGSRVVYLFEFKLFGTAEEALDQIKQKEYYQKYSIQDQLKDHNTPLTLIGVEFSETERNIGEWCIEKIT